MPTCSHETSVPLSFSSAHCSHQPAPSLWFLRLCLWTPLLYRWRPSQVTTAMSSPVNGNMLMQMVPSTE